MNFSIILAPFALLLASIFAYSAYSAYQLKKAGELPPVDSPLGGGVDMRIGGNIVNTLMALSMAIFGLLYQNPEQISSPDRGNLTGGSIAFACLFLVFALGALGLTIHHIRHWQDIVNEQAPSFLSSLVPPGKANAYFQVASSGGAFLMGLFLAYAALGMGMESEP